MIKEETEALQAGESQQPTTQPVFAAALDDASANVVSLDTAREKYRAVITANTLLEYDARRFNSPREHWEHVLDNARNRATAFNRAEMLLYVAKRFAPSEEEKQTVLDEAMEATKQIPKDEPTDAFYRQAMMRADIFLESGKREHLGAAIKAAQNLPDSHIYNPTLHSPEQYSSQASGFYLIIDRLIERLDKLGGIE